MPTAADLIEEAARYLGTVEDPPGSNHNVITEAFADMTGWEWARSGNPWCDMSVSIWLTAIGIATEFAYCPTHVNDFKKRGAWLAGGDADCEPGMVVFFDWDGDGVADHVGIVEQTGDQVITIEGNSGGPNGDGVWRQRRARSLILGYGRVAYSEAAPAPPAVPEPAPQPAPKPDNPEDETVQLIYVVKKDADGKPTGPVYLSSQLAARQVSVFADEEYVAGVIGNKIVAPPKGTTTPITDGAKQTRDVMLVDNLAAFGVK